MTKQSKPKDFTFVLRGTLWGVQFTNDKVKLGDVEGEVNCGSCDYLTNMIYIDSGMSDCECVKTLFHEIGHANLSTLRFDKLKEETVVETNAQARWEVDPQIPEWVWTIMKDYRANVLYSLTSGLTEKTKILKGK